MVQEDTRFETDDGTKLYLYRWRPGSASQTADASHPGSASQTLAVLHVVHGMAEHAGRYRRLAEKMCGAGIEVWAADQRGHGRTADLSVNGPGSGGLLGHCADKNTFDTVTADIHGINREIRKTRPGIPLFLLGHSWGSFIVQNYIETFGGKNIDGCILSGTRGPDGLKVAAGKIFMALLAAVCGCRRGLALAKAMADGPYSRPFRPNRTPFDWLSRDEAEVDAYFADPLSGKLCSAGFYRDLAKGLYRIHRPGAMAKIPRDLPVYIFCGSSDPVGDMGASPTELVNAYRSRGIGDMEFVLYPGARHETLNETNREEVMDNVLSWINRRIDSGAQAAETPKED